MQQSPSWDVTNPQLVMKLLALYKTRRFITAFIRTHHPSLFSARSIQFMPPHPTSRRSTLILSSHLHLGIASGLFPSGIPNKTLYATLLPLYMPHAPPISFYFIWSPEQYLVRSTDHKVHSHVVFSTPLLSRSSWLVRSRILTLLRIQIFVS